MNDGSKYKQLRKYGRIIVYLAQSHKVHISVDSIGSSVLDFACLSRIIDATSLNSCSLVKGTSKSAKTFSSSRHFINFDRSIFSDEAISEYFSSSEFNSLYVSTRLAAIALVSLASIKAASSMTSSRSGSSGISSAGGGDVDSIVLKRSLTPK